MAMPILDPTAVHRPRNVDWKRAAALLYGDWGTSKAYVIGLAFAAAGFSSLPIILAVCLLDTAVVGLQLHHCLRALSRWRRCLFRRRGIAKPVSSPSSTGALLLIANFIVTAALSGWAAVSYLDTGAGKYAPH